jgi:hypothetical protein
MALGVARAVEGRYGRGLMAGWDGRVGLSVPTVDLDFLGI